MAYTSSGPTYQAVCATIGWRADIQAVKVLAGSGRVFVTGTLLKPDEWRLLQRHDGDTLPDGRRIEVRHVPVHRL